MSLVGDVRITSISRMVLLLRPRVFFASGPKFELSLNLLGTMGDVSFTYFAGPAWKGRWRFVGLLRCCLVGLILAVILAR